jgi:hypothetical protein
LNDLLGAKEAGESETLAHLPKDEAGKPKRAPENFDPDLSEMTASAAGKLADTKHRFRSRLTQRI